MSTLHVVSSKSTQHAPLVAGVTTATVTHGICIRHSMKGIYTVHHIVFVQKQKQKQKRREHRVEARTPDD